MHDDNSGDPHRIRVQNTRACDGCFWQGQCEASRRCEDYVSVFDDDDVAYDDRKERREFMRQWFKYVGLYD